MRDELTTDIDREIQEALAVEPSPDFVARVRTRLASEPEAAPWRAGWLVAAVLAVAVVLALALPRPRIQVPSGSGDIRLAPAVVRHVEPEAAAPPVAEASSGSTRPRPRVPAQPEVLVSPVEMEAVRSMMAAVRDGRFHVLTVSFDDGAALASIPEITIPPIAIEPIDGSAEKEGVSQ